MQFVFANECVIDVYYIKCIEQEEEEEGMPLAKQLNAILQNDDGEGGH